MEDQDLEQVVDEIVGYKKKNKSSKEESRDSEIIKSIDWFLSRNAIVRKDGKHMESSFRSYCKTENIYKTESEDDWISIYTKFKNREF